MQLKVFFEHIYKPLPSDAFYPNRKNGGILVHYFFQKGGSNHYPCNKHHLISSDVAGERKLYDGTRTLTQQMKKSFPSILPEELTIYIEKLLNQETAQKVARNFGIQPKKISMCQPLRKRWFISLIYISIRSMMKSVILFRKHTSDFVQTYLLLYINHPYLGIQMTKSVYLVIRHII